MAKGPIDSLPKEDDERDRGKRVPTARYDAVPVEKVRKKFSAVLSLVGFAGKSHGFKKRNKLFVVVTPVTDEILSRANYVAPSGFARNNISDILNRVHYGNEVIVIERHGKNIAAVVSPDLYQELLLRKNKSRVVVDITSIVEDTRKFSARDNKIPRLGGAPKP